MSAATVLSLVLAAAGVTGLYLAGRGSWTGWALGLAVQPVWAAFAVLTGAYGLLVSCLAYGAVNAANLHRAYRTAHPTTCGAQHPILPATCALARHDATQSTHSGTLGPARLSWKEVRP